MIRFLLKRRMIAYLIIGWAFLLGCLPINSLAMPVSSKVLRSETKNLREADLTKIYSFMEKGIVRNKLVKMKIKSSDIKARLANLSDSQIHRLAVRIDKVKLGGDVGGVLVIALIVGIVVLVLYLTGQSLHIETGTRKN